MIGGMPPMGGGPPPGMGAPPGAPPMGMGMGGPPPFPSLDPGAMMQAGAPIAAMQQQDQQGFAQQQDAILAAVLEALKSQPNPAAQAAMSEPGYPTTSQAPA